MKYIKPYQLFESAKIEEIDIKSIFDINRYIDYLAYFESWILKGNYYEDFKIWLIYTGFKRTITTGQFTTYYKDAMARKQDVEAKIVIPVGYDGSFNYEDKLKEFPDMDFNSFLDSLGENLRYAGPVKNMHDKAVKEAVVKTISERIKDVLDNIFWPGNMPTIKRLKVLDFFDKDAVESYQILQRIEKSMDEIITRYSSMEKDLTSLAKKCISFLHTLSENNIEIFKGVIFPETFNNIIIKYFKEADDSFKVADELRKTNTNIYNKIKELIPNLDTSADLGDLGF